MAAKVSIFRSAFHHIESADLSKTLCIDREDYVPQTLPDWLNRS